MVMRVAIDFDNQAESWAEEVDDEVADDLLTPELVAAELRVRNLAPEPLFGLRGIAAHLAGAAMEFL
jgi:hypothetical protein